MKTPGAPFAPSHIRARPMRLDALIAAIAGAGVLARACVIASASKTLDGPDLTLYAHCALAFALSLYAALVGSEEFSPTQRARSRPRSPCDADMSDFDAYAHRGRAAMAYASRGKG